MSKQNENSSKSVKAESKPAPVISKPAAIKLTAEQAETWEALRASNLKVAYADLAKLPADKVMELAKQRINRLMDERHNTAALKLAASNESMSLTALLDSKRLSAESKSNTQEAFANLLMSGTLSGSAKKSALEVFKSGKVAEMAAFLATQGKAESK